MNQTLKNFNDTLEEITNYGQVIQSLLKRVDILEAKPDATREMLAEYVRNFDTLSNMAQGIIQGIETYQGNENEVLASIQATVEDYHWIIDRSTLEGLKQLVERETGFSLQKYVSYVQRQCIQAEFKKLKTSLENQLVKNLREVKELQEENNKLVQEQNKQLKEQNKTISENGSMMLVLMGFLAILIVGIFFILFGSLINAFVTHPVLSAIVFTVLVVVLGVLAFWVKSTWQEQDDSNESSDDDEEE